MADEVLARADAWLASDPDPDTRAELTAILAAARGGDAAATSDLRERFGPPLEFGTAGLRGLLGAGSSRMNRVVVRTVTAGLADYLLAVAPGAVSRGVVIGYDARHKSRDLAEDTARVLVGKGIPVHLAHRPWPTPVTAWLVRRTTAAAGVMVTASHNPPEYNGYKVYWGNGAQIIPPHDTGIAAAIAKVAAASGHAQLVMPELDAARADGMVKDLGEDAHEAYVAAVQALRTTGGAEKLVVAYTPLHGVGATSVEAVFEAARVGPLHVEPSQRDPDPRFPTVAFPNPEEKGAMDAVLALARAVGAELVLANDPDADRLCVAVPDPDDAGAYRVLTGDQVGAVLADYMLATTPPIDRRLVATTIVSSQLLKYLAAAVGADYRETLTGFKWIANAAMDWATKGGVFLMGYEEALGYTVGELVRDKDGVSAALILADLVAWNRGQGRTLLDHLADVYRRVGLFLTEQVSWTLPGAGGIAQIGAAMQRFRAAPPTELGGAAVEEVVDLAAGTGDLPASDVLIYRLAAGRRIIMRPSGTEPKLKSYYEVRVEVAESESLDAARSRGLADLARLRDAHQSVLRAP